MDYYNAWLNSAVIEEHINYYEYSNFKNIQLIGKGSYGSVSRVNWKNTNLFLVIKSFNNDEQTLKEIINELRLIKKINYHENIIRFCGITKIEDEIHQMNKYSLVLEYANNGTLNTYLCTHFNVLDWNEKIHLALQLASAVEFLHEVNIIHRDLRPNNILIHNKNIKLADLGLSKKIAETSNNTTPKVLGVMPYVDPKTFDIQNKFYKFNKTSDVYSVGVLMWQISSGYKPFRDSDYDASLLLNIFNGKREEMINGTPVEYYNLYTECWKHEPNERPNMQKVAKALKVITEQDYYNQISEENNNQTGQFENFKKTNNEYEKWIKKKLEDEDIIYFEYSEFSKIEKIGEGGFGVVNKAETSDKKQVALKCLIEKKSSEIGEDFIKNFIKELKNLRKVSHHDNVISFLGISKDNGYIMVLEYANEGNLRDYLKKKFKSLEWENKIQMALDITCGLKCLHSRGIIHRDLTLDYLNNYQKIRLIQWAIELKLLNMDPQCFKNIKYVRREKSDIYSLGVLLWEITSGHPPFHNTEERDMLGYHIGHKNLREEPIKGTPLEYQQLYQKCWDEDPEKRPNINEVYNEILRQSNANDANEQQDSLAASTSDSLKNLNIQSELCIETELID